MQNKNINLIKFYLVLISLLLCTNISASDEVLKLKEHRHNSRNTTAKQNLNGNHREISVKEFQKFVAAYDLIKQYYVRDVSDHELISNAIKGMVSNLDPHSTYLNESEIKFFEDFNSGNFVGIGVDVMFNSNALQVISTMEDTPAHKAGIKNGDLIVKINDKELKNISYTQAVAEMTGKPNTQVKLLVYRPSVDKKINFSIKRETIKLTSVNAKHLENGYGYVRIKNFNTSTSKEFYNKMQYLINNSPNKKIKGLILDLRDNPGGIINSAVDICSFFIKNALVTYIQGKDASSKINYISKKMPMTLYNVPLVVIINEGSASAAEIVASALQDHKRALILGTKSFGKGSVQSIAKLTDNAEVGIKITTYLYYSPKGHSIQLSGVHPDIEIKSASITFAAAEDTIREEDFDNHIKNKQLKPEENNQQKTTTKSNNAKDKLLADYQIYQSLQILKGMRFVKITTPVL